MNDRLVNTSIQILRLLSPSGLHTNEIIRQTSPDRTHIIEAIRFLETGQLIRVENEKNWKFGQKKTIIPTELGFEIRTLMEDLDRYNDALSRFKQTRMQFVDLSNIYGQSTWVEKDQIRVVDRSGTHKVKDEAEADDLIMRINNATRSKLKSMGWTDDEIELSDDVEYGLSLVNTFCDRNIFSALGHRYVFIFYRFNLDKIEIARNILREIIINEQKKQLGNLLSGDFGRGSEREDEYATIDRMYNIMYNQIVDPILSDLEDVFDIEKYEGPEAEKMENTKKICHSLLFNRFVSSDVKNVISCLLRVLHHHTTGNTTPLIDQVRIFQRANLISGMRNIDEELRSKRKRLTSDKKLGLEVAKEYNSMLEHWFRRDDEGESDENSLWSSIHPPNQSTSRQSDKYSNRSDKNNEVDSV